MKEMNEKEKILDAAGYGICLFSLEVLQDFLKERKIRSKKLLDKYQKEKDLYLVSQKEGTWMPIVQINALEYVVKLEGYDAPFDEAEWEQKFAYAGFNLEIKDTLCIADIGRLLTYEEEEFREYEGTYQVMCGYPSVLCTKFQYFKYDVPSGKYLLSVKGYAKKTPQGKWYDPGNCGFYFSLKKTDAFVGFQNPRESDLYDD